MGISREEHKEPDVVVTGAAQASPNAESDESDMWVENKEILLKPDNQIWAGAPQTPRVKIEGEEVMDIDTLATKRQELEGTLARSKPPKIAVSKPEPKPRPLDPEETEELLRLEMMLAELGVQDDQETSNKEGRVYVFRFPETLPELYATDPATAGPVKEEPEDDVVMLDKVATGPPVDLTNDANDAEIKEEDGAAAAAAIKDALPGYKMDKSGYLGNLVVRKSGRAELDFGGMMFDVAVRMPPPFLEMAVLVEEADQKRRVGEAPLAGTTYSMGRIIGQFGCVPKWSEPEEWVVDPALLSELEAEATGKA